MRIYMTVTGYIPKEHRTANY